MPPRVWLGPSASEQGVICLEPVCVDRWHRQPRRTLLFGASRGQDGRKSDSRRSAPSTVVGPGLAAIAAVSKGHPSGEGDNDAVWAGVKLKPCDRQHQQPGKQQPQQDFVQDDPQDSNVMVYCPFDVRVTLSGRKCADLVRTVRWTLTSQDNEVFFSITSLQEVERHYLSDGNALQMTVELRFHLVEPLDAPHPCPFPVGAHGLTLSVLMSCRCLAGTAPAADFNREWRDLSRTDGLTAGHRLEEDELFERNMPIMPGLLPPCQDIPSQFAQEAIPGLMVASESAMCKLVELLDAGVGTIFEIHAPRDQRCKASFEIVVRTLELRGSGDTVELVEDPALLQDSCRSADSAVLLVEAALQGVLTGSHASSQVLMFPRAREDSEACVALVAMVVSRSFQMSFQEACRYLCTRWDVPAATGDYWQQQPLQAPTGSPPRGAEASSAPGSGPAPSHEAPASDLLGDVVRCFDQGTPDVKLLAGFAKWFAAARAARPPTLDAALGWDTTWDPCPGDSCIRVHDAGWGSASEVLRALAFVQAHGAAPPEEAAGQMLVLRMMAQLPDNEVFAVPHHVVMGTESWHLLALVCVEGRGSQSMPGTPPRTLAFLHADTEWVLDGSGQMYKLARRQLPGSVPDTWLCSCDVMPRAVCYVRGPRSGPPRGMPCAAVPRPPRSAAQGTPGQAQHHIKVVTEKALQQAGGALGGGCSATPSMVLPLAPGASLADLQGQVQQSLKIPVERQVLLYLPEVFMAQGMERLLPVHKALRSLRSGSPSATLVLTFASDPSAAVVLREPAPATVWPVMCKFFDPLAMTYCVLGVLLLPPKDTLLQHVDWLWKRILLVSKQSQSDTQGGFNRPALSCCVDVGFAKVAHVRMDWPLIDQPVCFGCALTFEIAKCGRQAAPTGVKGLDACGCASIAASLAQLVQPPPSASLVGRLSLDDDLSHAKSKARAGSDGDAWATWQKAVHQQLGHEVKLEMLHVARVEGSAGQCCKGLDFRAHVDGNLGTVRATAMRLCAILSQLSECSSGGAAGRLARLRPLELLLLAGTAGGSIRLVWQVSPGRRASCTRFDQDLPPSVPAQLLALLPAAGLAYEEDDYPVVTSGCDAGDEEGDQANQETEDDDERVQGELWGERPTPPRQAHGEDEAAIEGDQNKQVEEEEEELNRASVDEMNTPPGRSTTEEEDVARRARVQVQGQHVVLEVACRGGERSPGSSGELIPYQPVLPSKKSRRQRAMGKLTYAAGTKQVGDDAPMSRSISEPAGRAVIGAQSSASSSPLRGSMDTSSVDVQSSGPDAEMHRPSPLLLQSACSSPSASAGITGPASPGFGRAAMDCRVPPLELDVAGASEEQPEGDGRKGDAPDARGAEDPHRGECRSILLTMPYDAPRLAAVRGVSERRDSRDSAILRPDRPHRQAFVKLRPGSADHSVASTPVAAGTRCPSPQPEEHSARHVRKSLDSAVERLATLLAEAKAMDLSDEIKGVEKQLLPLLVIGKRSALLSRDWREIAIPRSTALSRSSSCDSFFEEYSNRDAARLVLASTLSSNPTPGEATQPSTPRSLVHTPGARPAPEARHWPESKAPPDLSAAADIAGEAMLPLPSQAPTLPIVSWSEPVVETCSATPLWAESTPMEESTASLDSPLSVNTNLPRLWLDTGAPAAAVTSATGASSAGGGASSSGTGSCGTPAGPSGGSGASAAGFAAGAGGGTPAAGSGSSGGAGPAAQGGGGGCGATPAIGPAASQAGPVPSSARTEESERQLIRPQRLERRTSVISTPMASVGYMWHSSPWCISRTPNIRTPVSHCSPARSPTSFSGYCSPMTGLPSGVASPNQRRSQSGYSSPSTERAHLGPAFFAGSATATAQSGLMRRLMSLREAREEQDDEERSTDESPERAGTLDFLLESAQGGPVFAGRGASQDPPNLCLDLSSDFLAYTHRGLKPSRIVPSLNAFVQTLLLCAPLMHLFVQLSWNALTKQRPAYACLVQIAFQFFAPASTGDSSTQGKAAGASSSGVVPAAQQQQQQQHRQQQPAPQQQGSSANVTVDLTPFDAGSIAEPLLRRFERWALPAQALPGAGPTDSLALFLRFVLWQLHDECKWPTLSPVAGHYEDSPIVRIFGGLLRSGSDMMDLDNSELEQFLVLNLELAGEPCASVLEAMQKDLPAGTPFLRLPPFFLVHLQRFRVSDGMPSKVSRHCRIDMRLELEEASSCMVRSVGYELRSFICHYGEAPDGGSYKAVVRHGTSQDWYVFEDTTVRRKPASEMEDVLQCEGHHVCFLMYRREDTKKINIRPHAV